jgi:SAM-dependent methyltransferase
MSTPVSDFAPSIFHPFYFVRKGLLHAMQQHRREFSGRMLDFGCGSKPYKSLFNVDEYIGVDYENEGHPHENEMIDIFYDGKTIPLPDAHFDCVLSSEVFEHVFNLDEVLRELNRVMKPGAKLLITCPFVWNEHEVPHDYARYTVFALKDMLAKHGFEVINVSKTGNFIKTIFQLYNLYFYTIVYPKVKTIAPLRWVYKFWVMLLNASGLFVNFLFQKNTSLYLNNVVLAGKK